jgi:hypothetical protein
MDEKLLPRERNLQKCTHLAEALLLAARLLDAIHLRSNREQTWKICEDIGSNPKGRYTSYARINIEMDVSGALPEAISLEFKDEEWIQSIDYEQIPFRCRRCHEHGNLIKECPLNKKQEAENTKIQPDEDGFIKPNHRNRENKKPSKAPTGSNSEAGTRTEGQDNTKKGEGGKGKEKAKEAREQVTKDNTDSPRNKCNRGVAQLLWMEKLEMPTPPCRRQTETRK